MKKYLILLIFALTQLSANAQKVNLNQFSFLTGSWEMKTAKGKISESWIKSKDSLNGKSYRHALSGDSVLTEVVVIKKIGNVFHYCVTGLEKNNTGTTNFKLISTENNIFIFENKAHDFPQRVIYQNKGKDQLLAWIEGEMNGKKMKSEFPYLRKK
ncbi:hypothetical protein FA048_03020 [Pedobacter polaris]|uniref:DUF6265 domain-containing protein n=1 Tax=Pedobacter polaris TaxID=2571273 RepID=A0A4U1CUP6_9SPHI|nr:DUF6265 family protein [Pedobacter polaris]TKC12604.1 hypothetical protein FA048_03020 [Pedobacter polaris]